jgi:hypothetical protein
MNNSNLDPQLAREAKAIVALAFRNGPIESFHAGITDAEMKAIMKNAVDHVYRFSVIKKTNPVRYEKLIEYGSKIARGWDDPETGVIQNPSDSHC